MDDLSREIGRLEDLLDSRTSGEMIDELATIRRGLSDARTSPVRLPNLRLGFQCKERWDDMVGDNRVRACGGCHRPVFDLSAMTHDEAEQLLATRGLTPCVRFYRRADGTVMTRDCPTSPRERRRLAVITTSFAAGTALASPTARAEPAPEPLADIDATTGEPVAIAGVISDQTNQPLAGVTVVATSASGPTLVVLTDERGVYSLTGASPGAYLVTFYYMDLTVDGGSVEVGKDKVAQLSRTLDVSQQRGEVITISMGLPEMGLPEERGMVLEHDYLMGIPVGRTFGVVLGQPEQPAVEWSVWGRLGIGTAEQHSTVLARGLTQPEPHAAAIFEAALSAELTVGVANDRKLRLGGWGELRTTSGPVAGGELVVTGLPPHPMASQIGGSGSFVLRAGGNAHVITGAFGFGYTGSFSRTDPWLAWLDHVVGTRLIISVNRSLDIPSEWSATFGLEVEPLGMVQAVVRRIDDR